VYRLGGTEKAAKALKGCRAKEEEEVHVITTVL
jgi:hypothetical protein